MAEKVLADPCVLVDNAIPFFSINVKIVDHLFP